MEVFAFLYIHNEGTFIIICNLSGHFAECLKKMIFYQLFLL